MKREGNDVVHVDCKFFPLIFVVLRWVTVRTELGIGPTKIANPIKNEKTTSKQVEILRVSGVLLLAYD